MSTAVRSVSCLNSRLALLGGAAVFLFASAASAFTIDFDDLPLGFVPGDVLTYDVDGVQVEITGNALQVVEISQLAYPGTGRQLVAGGFFGEIEISIESGFTFGELSIANRVNETEPRGTAPELFFPPHSEVDVIEGRAFDSAGTMIDLFSSALPIETLSGEDFVRAVFDDVGNTAYVLDDVSFTIVPEPSTALLIGVGVIVLSGTTRPASRRRGPGSFDV